MQTETRQYFERRATVAPYGAVRSAEDQRREDRRVAMAAAGKLWTDDGRPEKRKQFVATSTVARILEGYRLRGLPHPPRLIDLAARTHPPDSWRWWDLQAWREIWYAQE